MAVFSEAYDLEQGRVAPEDVLIIDLGSLYCCEATVVDFNENGCRLSSAEVGRFTDAVAIRQRDSDKVIRGWVRAVLNDTVEISFTKEEVLGQEKRKEARRAVHIPAKISARGGNRFIACVISNAGRSGCRVEAEGLTRLPDSISIHIPALDLPVPGEIVWRQAGSAGIRLDWSFAQARTRAPAIGGGASKSGQKSAAAKSQDAEAEVSAAQERANKSGFGPSRRRKKV